MSGLRTVCVFVYVYVCVCACTRRDPRNVTDCARCRYRRRRRRRRRRRSRRYTSKLLRRGRLNLVRVRGLVRFPSACAAVPAELRAARGAPPHHCRHRHSPPAEPTATPRLTHPSYTQAHKLLLYIRPPPPPPLGTLGSGCSAVVAGRKRESSPTRPPRTSDDRQPDRESGRARVLAHSPPPDDVAVRFIGARATLDDDKAHRIARLPPPPTDIIP